VAIESTQVSANGSAAPASVSAPQLSGQPAKTVGVGETFAFQAAASDPRYRIYYGKDAGNLAMLAQVANPGIASFVVNELSTGTWYFAVKAYTSADIESGSSDTASKVNL
jgi:hypothetical protein